MEPSLNPDDITALNAEFLDRRTRAEEQGEDVGTGDGFLDTAIKMAGRVGDDIGQSFKTGEVGKGAMLGLTRAVFELGRLIGPGFIGGEGGLADIVSKGADKNIETLEANTSQIAAFASPYVVAGTASILGAGSLAARLGVGSVSKFLMQVGAGGASDFTVGATMEPPGDENIAHMIVALAEEDPDSAILQTAAPLFEFLASEDDDPEVVKRLKRGAVEALTNVAAELGFIVVKGIPALVSGLKKLNADGGLARTGDVLEGMGSHGDDIRRQLHKEGVDGIDLLYGNDVTDPRQVEMLIAAGGQRLGVSLNAIGEMVKQARKLGEKGAGEVTGAAQANLLKGGAALAATVGTFFSEMFGGGEAEAGGTGKILATMAEAGLEVAEPFHSKAARVVEEATTAKAPGNQWKGTLKNAGVKDEEMEWLGLNDFLRGNDTITKDDLAAHVELNKIDVQEITKGGVAEEDIGRAEIFELDRRVDEDGLVDVLMEDRVTGRQFDVQIDADAGNVSVREEGRFLDNHAPINNQTESDAIVAIQRELEVNPAGAEPGGPTKFERFTLPGGENYRELLMTLPLAKFEAPELITELPEGFRVGHDPRAAAVGKFHVLPPDQASARPFAGSHSTEEEAVATALLKINEDRKAIAQGKIGLDTFTGGHFDESNVLAHVRFNERVDPDGARVLFIEEIQSDWMAKGRRHGFKADIPGEDTRNVLDTRLDAITEERGVLAENRDPVTNRIVEEARWHELAREGERLQAEWIRQNNIFEGRTLVPDVPFKKTWHELTFKRMIRYASENDFDRVAWTTGKQQAERYDLSKQVDELLVTKLSDGTFEISANLPGGGTHGFGAVPGNQLENTVGQTLADTIRKQEIGQEVYSAADLQVGGEGLKSFYDKILPNFAKKLGKKFGTKPEMVRFDQGGSLASAEGQELLAEAAERLSASVENLAFHIRAGNETARSLGVTEGEFIRIRSAAIAGEEGPGSFTAHSMVIPDRLRETALKEGFPLFGAGLAPLGMIPEPPGPPGSDQ